MRHRTRRLLRRGTGWILVWTALVAVPPLALAGSRAGYDQGIRPPGSTSPAPVKAHMVTAWQTQEQAIATSLGALNARVRAAQATNDPAQMRMALAEVLQQQTVMQEQIAMCWRGECALERWESARHGS